MAGPGSAPPAAIVERVRAAFEEFVQARAPFFPTVRERMAADPWRASWWLWPARWLPLGDLSAAGRRYVFLNARHAELVASFGPTEAILIGGPSDRRFARRAGLPFCWQADLYLGARDILFRGPDARRAFPILERWRAFFQRQADPCFLVVANDTSPISLLLVAIAASCPNMRSVCLQHGLFNAGYDQDDIEGRNSDLNLVYDESQRTEMLRRLPRARVGVMGYPAQFPERPPAPEAAPRVILVGTGEVERPANYQLALRRFAEAAQGLLAAGMHVEYRPHPVEPEPVPLSEPRLPVRREPKAALLGGARKVFVGFNSTLLYEAHCFGHEVIVLDDPALPGYALSPFGHRLQAAHLAELPRMVAEGHATRASALPYPGRLRERFEAGLREALGPAKSAGQPLSSGA
jgi:hypothetical protein